MHRARAGGVDIEDLSAVVLTHEHGDHARGAVAAARMAGCPVIASAGTLRALGAELDGLPTAVLAPWGPLRIGSLTLQACHVSHDAAEPLAIAIDGPVAGQRVGIAYDVGLVSASLRHLLLRCACVIVEANHDDSLLSSSPYPPAVRRRIAGPDGHLSNQAAAVLLREVYHPALTTVILAHLSSHCNLPELALQAVWDLLQGAGFRGDLLTAPQGRPLPPIELGARPQLRLGLEG